jgi:hypothetical protein
MSWVDLFGAAPDFPLLPDDAIAEVEKAMAAQALAAWRTAGARVGLGDHNALVQHADAMTRWSERLRMAMAGELTGHEEWMVR